MLRMQNGMKVRVVVSAIASLRKSALKIMKDAGVCQIQVRRINS
jgi:hypothetical protein